MPFYDLYRTILGEQTVGDVRRKQSHDLINYTWWNDFSSQIAYLYDWYHDSKSQDAHKLRNLSPQKDDQKIPIDIKYLTNSSQTYSKDTVTYHIQLRPSQKCNVDYYDTMFGRYNAIFPVGLYIDIKDNQGNYNKWLIVGLANYYDPMFSTYEVLPCDKVFQWVFENTKFNMSGVLRSQNSYNSGVWTDNKITSIQDQQKFIVPINQESQNLFYNQRMIIDSNVDTEPRAWVISKVNRIANNGLVQITLAQDRYDQNHDYIERAEDGRIIGMWADYYSNGVVPNQNTEQDEQSEIRAVIEYSGFQNNQLKIGGNFRTFSVHFFDKDGNELNYHSGSWTYKIDDSDSKDLISESSSELENSIQIKFIGDDTYIGDKLIISFTTDDGKITTSIEMNLSAL